MAQLSKGTNYTATGDMSFVTHTNLNAHVSNAKLIGGAIGEQIANAVSSNEDLLLIKKGDDLFKQTKGEFTNSIISNEITVNNLSVAINSADSVDSDIIEMTGATNASYIDLNNASIFSSSTTNYNINFGFGATSQFPAPTGWTTPTTYNLFGGTTNFIRGTNVATGVNHNVNIDGELNVTGKIKFNNKVVLTEAPVAIKTGVCQIFGTGILHRTGEFDIPEDETWLVTFHARWKTRNGDNTMPDWYYTVKAFASKDTYSDVELGTWTQNYPPKSGVNEIYCILQLTKGSLANMAKKIKFVAYDINSTTTVANIQNANTESHFEITLNKVKTETFNNDSSIL